MSSISNTTNDYYTEFGKFCYKSLRSNPDQKAAEFILSRIFIIWFCLSDTTQTFVPFKGKAKDLKQFDLIPFSFEQARNHPRYPHLLSITDSALSALRVLKGEISAQTPEESVAIAQQKIAEILKKNPSDLKFLPHYKHGKEIAKAQLSRGFIVAQLSTYKNPLRNYAFPFLDCPFLSLQEHFKTWKQHIDAFEKTACTFEELKSDPRYDRICIFVQGAIDAHLGRNNTTKDTAEKYVRFLFSDNLPKEQALQLATSASEPTQATATPSEVPNPSSSEPTQATATPPEVPNPLPTSTGEESPKEMDLKDLLDRLGIRRSPSPDGA